MLKRLFQEESIEPKDWRTEDSILKFIADHINSDGKLSDYATDLPDEERDPNKTRFAPGLMDSILGPDDSDDSQKRINELVAHLKNIATTGDKHSERAFFNIVSEDTRVTGVIDSFLQGITNERLSIEPYLFNYAKDLATKTNKRNAVKFGIAISSLCGNGAILEDLKILGLHNEFTLYATIAILNLSTKPAPDLWQLAQKVDGWGKIQLVNRLATLELNNEIRNWLLIDGYKNSIMHEYLVYTCAMEGHLDEKIAQTQIDDRLFKAAGEIIEALLNEEGPAVDISAYDHAASVIEHFIRHADEHAKDISHLAILYRIKDFLTELQDTNGYDENGWTKDIISNCLIAIVGILNRTDWKPIVTEALKSEDNLIYWNAKQASEQMGIDLWETVWNRLQQQPHNSRAWYDVTHYAQPEYADQIIDFALKALPLDTMATGPNILQGYGPEYETYNSLEFITVYLRKFPGKGEQIILTSLNAPVIRTRNTVITILGDWGRENWSDKIERALHRLKDMEPNEDTKADIEALLDT